MAEIYQFRSPTTTLFSRQIREYWFEQALAAEDSGDCKAAIAFYEKILACDHNDAEVWVNLGTIQYNQKNLNGAEVCFRRAIEINPRYTLAYFNLGSVLDKKERRGDAIQAYEKAIEIDPCYAEAHRNLAVLFEAADKTREAIQHYRRCAQHTKDPSCAELVLDQIQILSKDDLQLVRKED